MTKSGRKKTTKCLVCKRRFAENERGRKRVYCSASCRQKAYELSKLAGPRLANIMKSDLARAELQRMVRDEVRIVFKQLGIEPPPEPPPEPTSPRIRRKGFKVIKND